MKFSALRVVVGVFSLAIGSQVSAETIGEALSKCSATENSLQRLVCYDRVVKDMNQYEGLDTEAARTITASPVYTPVAPQRPLPQQPSVAQRPAPPSEQDEFGLEHKRDTDEMAQGQSSVIAQVKKNAYRKYEFTLNNGQVWRQTDDSSIKLEEGIAVQIERGVLGSFFLSIDGLNKRMRVKRIK
ncbi:hypothetical protein [Alteromonas sp. KUL49]|uniref:hypothetical protein n=1 Tax=Alteromonas sp. KUL49 TaxID=2480798 RepID=UPI00102F0934|nr:hypothetical protein [Alteromonas sp. KUL49]TAP42571.1 hypothetical protein EYS00_02870 [Alteromonas sp. KUL49]GEA10206.1 hypothetical protein KUL49_05810 [Alteromonas sp. KUL49]